MPGAAPAAVGRVASRLGAVGVHLGEAPLSSKLKMDLITEAWFIFSAPKLFGSLPVTRFSEISVFWRDEVLRDGRPCMGATEPPRAGRGACGVRWPAAGAARARRPLWSLAPAGWGASLLLCILALVARAGGPPQPLPWAPRCGVVVERAG